MYIYLCGAARPCESSRRGPPAGQRQWALERRATRESEKREGKTALTMARAEQTYVRGTCCFPGRIVRQTRGIQGYMDGWLRSRGVFLKRRGAVDVTGAEMALVLQNGE